MLKVAQVAHDYQIESLQKWIGKQIASIVLPPNTTVNLSSYLIWSKQVAIGIHDCFESGYAELRNVSPTGDGKVDTDMHQAIYFYIEKSYNPSDANYFFSDTFYMPPPNYGVSIGFDALPKFTIKKIEIYSEDFILNEKRKNIGQYDKRKKYNKTATHVNNDCVLILYDVKDRVLIFEAEKGGFNIYSEKSALDKVINRSVLGYTTYENPVKLSRRLIIE